MYFGMNDKERLDVPKVKTDTTLCAAYILDQIRRFLTYLNTPYRLTMVTTIVERQSLNKWEGAELYSFSQICIFYLI